MTHSTVARQCRSDTHGLAESQSRHRGIVATAATCHSHTSRTKPLGSAEPNTVSNVIKIAAISMVGPLGLVYL